MDEKKTWFWNQDTNKLEFVSECNGYYDSKEDLESKFKRKGFKFAKKASLQNRLRENIMG